MSDREPIYSIASEDPEMRKAIDKARATFPKFQKEADGDLSREIPALDDILVKVYLAHPEAPDKGEHMWVRYTGFFEHHEKRFTGILLSAPRGKVRKMVNVGDSVNVTNEKVSDWIIVENDKARGAFTVNLIRSRMSKEERKEHDSHYPFSFE